MTKLNIEEVLVSIQNSSGWVFAQSNTIAGGSITSISNSAGWVVAVSNTGGLYTLANSSNLNIANSAGWIVNVANTQGTYAISNTLGSYALSNTAGWVMAQSNTVNEVNIINSAGWVVAQSNTISTADISIYSASTSKGLPIMAQRKDTNTIVFDSYFGILRMDYTRNLFTTIRDASNNERGLNVDSLGRIAVTLDSTSIANTAGWIIAQSNTVNAVSIINSAGWTIAQADTSQWYIKVVNTSGWVVSQANTINAVSIINSAGWIVAQSNTVNTINIINTAGWLVLVKPLTSNGSAVTSVALTNSTINFLSSNLARLGATVFNNSTGNVYLKLGATATTASFTALLYPNGYYETPFNYTGVIDGISTSSQGTVILTETT